jgi:hypothetical protein
MPLRNPTDLERVICGVLAVVFVAACRDVAASPPHAVPPVIPGEPHVPGAPNSAPEFVSLVQLIVTPERFDKKKVQVVGYLHLQFEGNGLFLHEEDASYWNTRNAVWVQVQDRWANARDGYVTVVGTFDASKRGHMDMFQGSLNQISTLDRRSKR